MTPEGKPGSRRYGRWAGNPKGRLENTAKCAEEVPIGRTYLRKQCGRDRGLGPGNQYCAQHAKRYINDG